MRVRNFPKTDLFQTFFFPSEKEQLASVRLRVHSMHVWTSQVRSNLLRKVGQRNVVTVDFEAMLFRVMGGGDRRTKNIDWEWLIALYSGYCLLPAVDLWPGFFPLKRFEGKVTMSVPLRSARRVYKKAKWHVRKWRGKKEYRS